MAYKFKQINKKDMKDILELFNYYIEQSTAVWITKKINTRELKEIIPFKTRKYKSYKISLRNIFCGSCCFKQYKKRQGYDRTAELSIYLKPEFTGKGIGILAMKFLEKKAKKAGIKVLIGSISGDNKNSIKLFRKAGYSKCAHFKKIGEKFGKILDVVDFQKIIG